MRLHQWPYVAIGLLGGLATLLLVRQHRITVELQSAIASEHAGTAKKAALLEEQKKLLTEQVSPDDLEKLRTERTSVSALRAEIEKMKRRAETIARTVLAPSSQNIIVPTLSDGPIAASFWKNAGRVTPDSTLETALWAAAGGDVDTLAGLLRFDGEAQDEADAIFEQLPVALRQELGTPKRLIALMAAKDVPLGSAQIVDQSLTTYGAQLKTLLVDEQGKSKEVRLSLRRDPAGWHFVVPARAVERYAAKLQAPVAPSQSR